MENKIEIEKCKYKKPLPEQECKVFDIGNGVIEIETPKFRTKPYKNPWRKHSKNEMVNIEDGEIKELNYLTNRADKENLSRFYKQKKYVYRLLLKNFTGAINERIIVLTYKNDFTDVDTCYKQVKNFRSKLERKIKSELNFVLVVVFHNEEKLHYELWVKVPNLTSLDLDNSMLEEMWR